MDTIACSDYETILKQMNKHPHPTFKCYGITICQHFDKIIRKNKEISNKLFLMRWGDNTEICNHELAKIPYFTKVRRINDRHGIVLNFNENRHWQIMRALSQRNDIDIPFENKKNILIWRGATTGYNYKEDDLENRDYSIRRNRLLFVDKFKDSDIVDAGFNQQTPYKGSDIDIMIHKNNMVKNNIHVHEMLRFKYIMSIDGNDVSSGLKWQLYSNSVVFMKKPRFISWLMEDMLEPYVHYIPVNDDFSNVEEQVQWANTHQEECKRISENATNYMKQFLDPKREELIHFLVVKKYLENVDIEYKNN